ncbi:MAG: prepilin-type cleavage/methylation domain-containing protein [Verrucomicrobiota bacterium]
MKTRAGFSRLVLFLALFAVLAVLAAVAIPNFVKARSPRSKSACSNNLRQIDGAKEQWALENKKSAGTPVVVSEVDTYFKGGAPKCSAGGTYTYGAVDKNPRCSMALSDPEGHVL